ncbi:MAG TPA: FtsQ-type POTRA domain-containing protein [Chloroflexi bacterium]|nr:FtsQ-type POTRA domain-containing protein [Chloroflexota bacterium]
MPASFGATGRKREVRGATTARRRTFEHSAPRRTPPARRISTARAAVASRITALLMATIFLAALALLFVSDAFYVYRLEAEGNRLVSEEEIFNQTQLEGYSIFFIDPSQAEERIESLPDIREARVTLSLPNRMAVRVEERRALLVWQTGEFRYGVDEEGLIVSLDGEDEPEMVITDLDSAPLSPGDSVNTQAVAAAAAYQDLLSGVDEFEYSAQYGLSYRDELGRRVYLGDGEKAALKVAILGALADRLANQGATVESIDVRFPDSPLYRTAEGSSTSP